MINLFRFHICTFCTKSVNQIQCTLHYIVCLSKYVWPYFRSKLFYNFPVFFNIVINSCWWIALFLCFVATSISISKIHFLEKKSILCEQSRFHNSFKQVFPVTKCPKNWKLTEYYLCRYATVFHCTLSHLLHKILLHSYSFS